MWRGKPRLSGSANGYQVIVPLASRLGKGLGLAVAQTPNKPSAGRKDKSAGSGSETADILKRKDTRKLTIIDSEPVQGIATRAGDRDGLAVPGKGDTAGIALQR